MTEEKNSLAKFFIRMDQENHIEALAIPFECAYTILLDGDFVIKMTAEAEKMMHLNAINFMNEGKEFVEIVEHLVAFRQQFIEKSSDKKENISIESFHGRSNEIIEIWEGKDGKFTALNNFKVIGLFSDRTMLSVDFKKNSVRCTFSDCTQLTFEIEKADEHKLKDKLTKIKKFAKWAYSSPEGWKNDVREGKFLRQSLSSVIKNSRR
mmetsp:Transcript_16315/g.24186  ORF Transcript_16315/g.24186 Transcript_16315/m.24186 type:complete len:208 (-) Transcript_16315:17-640(-)